MSLRATGSLATNDRATVRTALNAYKYNQRAPLSTVAYSSGTRLRATRRYPVCAHTSGRNPGVDRSGPDRCPRMRSHPQWQESAPSPRRSVVGHELQQTRMSWTPTKSEKRHEDQLGPHRREFNLACHALPPHPVPRASPKGAPNPGARFGVREVRRKHASQPESKAECSTETMFEAIQPRCLGTKADSSDPRGTRMSARHTAMSELMAASVICDARDNTTTDPNPHAAPSTERCSAIPSRALCIGAAMSMATAACSDRRTPPRENPVRARPVSPGKRQPSDMTHNRTRSGPSRRRHLLNDKGTPTQDGRLRADPSSRRTSMKCGHMTPRSATTNRAESPAS